MDTNQLFLVWITLGLVLVASELFTGTFHLLFFGFAALLTGAFAYFGVAVIWQQILIFGILSVASFFFVQKKIPHRKQGGFESDLHHTVTLSDDIPSHGEAMIQYQGTPWTFVNTESFALSKGQKVVIVRTEGVKIYVRAQDRSA